MLLTSSQVSVALSSIIVISFTSALFLSGYVIQQRTVGHLRAAIRPNPSPQIYLPDRFRQDTTELADGTIVVLDEYDRPSRQRISRSSGPEGQDHAGHNSENDGAAATVKEALAESAGEQEQQKVPETENVEGQEQGSERQHAPVETKPQPAPWAVRAEDEVPPDATTEGLDGEAEKPISRAERRRRIKEEIMRLAQGEEPVYYQRRLW